MKLWNSTGMVHKSLVKLIKAPGKILKNMWNLLTIRYQQKLKTKRNPNFWKLDSCLYELFCQNYIWHAALEWRDNFVKCSYTHLSAAILLPGSWSINKRIMPVRYKFSILKEIVFNLVLRYSSLWHWFRNRSGNCWEESQQQFNHTSLVNQLHSWILSSRGLQ